MNDKLIVAIDVENFFEAKKIIEILEDQVAFFKVGLELMASGDYFKIIEFLAKKNKKIFADLKIFDISQTIAKTVKNLSQYPIDFLTMHCASLDIMQKANENKGKIKILGVTVLTNLDENDLEQMGFDKNLKLQDLVLKKAELALKSGLDGVVASAHEAQFLRQKIHDNFIIVTPGIRLENVKNDDQKRVSDVKSALGYGADYLVVGRPITTSENPQLMAKKFNNLIHEFIANNC